MWCVNAARIISISAVRVIKIKRFHCADFRLDSNPTRWECVMAMASASVISRGFISPLIPRIFFTIKATWVLSALPLPVMAFLTCSGVYSAKLPISWRIFRLNAPRNCASLMTLLGL